LISQKAILDLFIFPDPSPLRCSEACTACATGRALRTAAKFYVWACVKSLLLPTAAEYFFERHFIFTISRSEIVKMKCLSKHYLALRAKFKFETDVFFMILRSKIMKNTSVSKEYSAAKGGKNFFTDLRGSVKILFMALRAKFKFETDVFFTISRSEIVKNTSVSKAYSAAEGGKNFFTDLRGSVKILFMALRAKLYYERQVIFTISRSEIVKMTCLSREDSAAEGGKILFMQRQVIF
jgi:hypothetical protein